MGLAVALSAVLYLAIAFAQSEHAGHVIMISIDGLMPDNYTAPELRGLKIPNLIQMKNEGAYAEGVEGIYPTVTYPSHTTLVTGQRPALHGIVQNRIFEAPTAPQLVRGTGMRRRSRRIRSGQEQSRRDS